MINFIKRLFTPEKLESIQFIKASKEEVSGQHPDALHELFESKKHGFLIKNFLSNDEVESINKNFDVMQHKNVATTSVGYTYPMVFAEFSLRNSELSEAELKESAADYFEKNANYAQEFKNDFGFDIKSKIQTFLLSIAGGRTVKVPKGFNDNGNYPFGNFRYLKPHGGGMAIHCGNYFQTKFKLFYSHLMESVKVENQMSYFIMIQKPEKGGALDIFNLRWQEGQTKTNNSEDKEVILPNGKTIFPDTDKKYEKQQIYPEPGDMILFQGGNIWHRVTEIEGSNPRVTFGGFMGLSKDKKSFYFWS